MRFTLPSIVFPCGPCASSARPLRRERPLEPADLPAPIAAGGRGRDRRRGVRRLPHGPPHRRGRGRRRACRSSRATRRRAASGPWARPSKGSPSATRSASGGWRGPAASASTAGAGARTCARRAEFTGRDRDGGYAERMVADARWVYRLPAGFSALEAAPLLCAGVIGYRSLRLSEIRPGGRLGLFGFGASAHLAIQVALVGECEVYAFTREEHHRRLAREMGAVWAGDIAESPGVALDAAVTFAPAGEIVPAALAHVAPGGVVAVNAIHMSPIPSFDYERLYGERVLRSVMNFTRRDAEEFLALAVDDSDPRSNRDLPARRREPRARASRGRRRARRGRPADPSLDAIGPARSAGAADLRERIAAPRGHRPVPRRRPKPRARSSSGGTRRRRSSRGRAGPTGRGRRPPRSG